MPSVFTIEGTSLGAAKKRKGKQCKRVRNPKTGCSMELCFVGKSKKCRSGWKFMKGSSSCSKR